MALLRCVLILTLQVQCLDEASWTEWVDSSSCAVNTLTEKGFQYRTRCLRTTENETNNFKTCNEDYDVIECTPREWELELTNWSDWTSCRGDSTSTCPGPGQRTKTRTCENGCDYWNISPKNLTIMEDCDVDKDGFQ